MIKELLKDIGLYLANDEFVNLSNQLDNKNIEISNLNFSIQVLVKDLNIYKKSLNEANFEINKLESRIDMKHSSLPSFKAWLEANIQPRAKFYNFGHGSKRVHTILKDSIKDKDIIMNFINENLKFNYKSYSSADSLIYYFMKVFRDKYPTVKYYENEMKLYGVREYWALAKETIPKLLKGIKSFDCDDKMVLCYSCLYHMLNETYGDQMWRLRCVIVTLRGGLGGHAMLTWVKSDVCNFVPIETTFLDIEQAEMWRNADKYQMTNQLFYGIQYSFDHENEYIKL